MFLLMEGLQHVCSLDGKNLKPVSYCVLLCTFLRRMYIPLSFCQLFACVTKTQQNLLMEDV